MSNKILLIDDDEDLLNTNEQILELFGYSVITSNDSKRGVDLYDEHHPCLSILDVKMPDINGYELFSMIRKLDSLAKVVIITGHEDRTESIKAKQNGLLDVIFKPMSGEALVEIIKKHNC